MSAYSSRVGSGARSWRYSVHSALAAAGDRMTTSATARALRSRLRWSAVNIHCSRDAMGGGVRKQGVDCMPIPVPAAARRLT